VARGAVRVEVDRTNLVRAPRIMNISSRLIVRSTVEAIASDARTFVPVDQGELKASIRTEFRPDGLGGAVIADAEHAASVEFGAQPHPIEPREAKFLHFFVDGREIFTTHVDHPGQTAQPFLRPALERNRGVFGTGRAIGREFLRRIRG